MLCFRFARRALLLVCLCLLWESQPNAIIGGADANWTLYPWLAKNVCQLPGQTTWEPCDCSSTVIDQFYAVTAAHCLNRRDGSRVGLLFASGEIVEVVSEITHPDFSWDSRDIKDTYGIVSESVADIGLQQLARPVESAGGKTILNVFNDKYWPTGVVAGTQATLLGWGATDNSDVDPTVLSPTLQGIDEIVQDNGSCKSFLDQGIAQATGGVVTESPFRFNDSLICGRPIRPLPNASAGSCLGDAGGLLFVPPAHGKKPEMVLGLLTDTLSVSRENPCGNGIDIYTRLTPEYLNWIRSVIAGGL